jgi:hypothetical protein
VGYSYNKYNDTPGTKKKIITNKANKLSYYLRKPKLEQRVSYFHDNNSLICFLYRELFRNRGPNLWLLNIWQLLRFSLQSEGSCIGKERRKSKLESEEVAKEWVKILISKAE